MAASIIDPIRWAKTAPSPPARPARPPPAACRGPGRRPGPPRRAGSAPRCRRAWATFRATSRASGRTRPRAVSSGAHQAEQHRRRRGSPQSAGRSPTARGCRRRAGSGCRAASRGRGPAAHRDRRTPVTTTATAVSRPMPGTRPTRAIASAATAIPGMPADQDRDARQGGDHQAREERVGEGLRRSRRRRRRSTQQPSAPPASEIKPTSSSARRMNSWPSRVCEEVDHQWWWAGQDPDVVAARDLDDRPGVGRLQHLAVEDLVRRAERDLAAVEAEHRVPAPAPGSRSCVAITMPRPSRASSPISASRLCAAGTSRPEKGSSSSSRLASWTSAARDQHPLALAAGEVAEGVVRPVRRRPPARAPRARGLAIARARAASTRAAGEARPSGRRRARETGKSSRERSVCGTVRGPAVEPRPSRASAAARRAGREAGWSCRRRWARAARRAARARPRT